MNILVTFMVILVLLFAITLTLNVLNKSMPSKKIVTWTCDKCNIELVRSQIKFGLCPKCGNKIPHFRGLSPWN
jgi:rubrerythrin